MSIAHKQDVAVTKAGNQSTPALVTNPFTEMERLFERMMRRDWMQPFNWDWSLARPMAETLSPRLPSVDVIDQNDQVTVRAELPGVEKKDIDVSVGESSLTLRAKAKSESKEEAGNYYRCEISQSAFTRTIPLPGSVDPDKVKAKLQDGILEIVIAKANGSRRKPVAIE